MRMLAKNARQNTCLLVLLCALTAAAGAQPPDNASPPKKPLWLVVTRPMFREALAPLITHRDKQFQTRLSTEPPADAIADCPRPPDYILLVGDDQPGSDDQPWYLPAKRFTQYYWRAGPAPTFASDSILGDTDGDRLPDIPVGRLPTRTAEQLQVIVEKILAWERRPPNLRNMQAALWTCDPAFGPLSRLFATPLALAQIDTRAPAWLQPWVLAGDAASAFCGVPVEQPATFAHALAARPALAIIMAHASPDAVYVMQAGDENVHFLPRHAAGPTDAGPGPPLLAIACHTGNFSRPVHGFAETLLFMPTGPVAVVGATAESHPLPNFYTGQAILDALTERPQRLGDLWTAAARGGATKRSFLYELLLKQMESERSQPTDPRRLQQDHPLLYALLGDPATRLPLPLPLKASLNAGEDGWSWSIAADDRPVGATKLLVQHRPLPSPITADAGTPQAARQALQTANAAYAFQTVATLEPAAEWKGKINQPGKLRLVAVTPDRLYATAFKLTPRNDP